MRAVLIYNPNSGGAGSVSADQLLGWLEEQGFDPAYEETAGERDLDSILKEDFELVAAAGGDGTIRAVAARLRGRKIPIAPIPLGTANNITQSLGITGTPAEIIAGLSDPVKRRFDLGCARTPFSSTYFLEAFGYGYYASGMEEYKPEEGKSVLRSLAAISETLSNFKAENCRLSLDGDDISGSYLMVALMNTPFFGPRLKFAPEANPADGLFDVVRIREDSRDNLFQYISGLLTETIADLPSVEMERGRKLEMIWSGTFPLHADAEVIPSVRGPEQPGMFPVTVEIMPAELEFWVPRSHSQQAGDDGG